MKFKRILVIFLGIAVLAFVVTAFVTYIYSLVVHGAGITDWGTAFRVAIILGIVLTFTGERKALK